MSPYSGRPKANSHLKDHEVNAHLAYEYENISEEKRELLRQQWGYSEEDHSLFQRKLDSFLQMLKQTEPVSWSLFLSRELQLLDLSLRDFVKIFGKSHPDRLKKDEGTLATKQLALRRRFLAYQMDETQYDSVEELRADLRAKEQGFFQSVRFLELLKKLEFNYPPSYYSVLQQHIKDCVHSLRLSSEEEVLMKLYVWKVIDLSYKQISGLLGRKVDTLQTDQSHLFRRYQSCLQDMSKHSDLYLYDLAKRVSPSQMSVAFEKDTMALLPQYYQNQQFVPVLKELQMFSPSLSPDMQWRHMKDCLAGLIRSERFLVLSYVWQVREISQGAMARLLKISESSISEALAKARQSFLSCLQVLNQRSTLTSFDQEVEETTPVVELYHRVVADLDSLSELQLKKHLHGLRKNEKKIFSASKVRALSKNHLIHFMERYEIWDQIVFITLVLQLGDVSITDLGRLKGLSFDQLLELSFVRDNQRLEFLHYLHEINSAIP